MLQQTARTIATVMVALTVVLSMGAGPAMAAQDDGGLLGGDDSGDGIDVGGDSGVSVGTDGVSVGGEDGINAGTDGVSVAGDEGVNISTDGVSVAGQDVGSDTVSDSGDSLPLSDGDGGLIATDGSNVEVGGDSGISVGTDGVSVGGDEGVNAGPEGVSVAGQDVGSGQLSGGDVAPDDGSVDIPTGPLPVDIMVSGSPVSGSLINIQSAEDAPGPSLDAVLFSGLSNDSSGLRIAPRLDIADANRTYIDLDGNTRINQTGLQDASGEIYTVNESGGTAILELSRDNIQTTVIGEGQGQEVGLVNVQNTPGTREGIVAVGIFPATIVGFGPSLPVGPDLPERLGGGIKCNDDRCVAGTSGINETIPSNNITDPIKAEYPFPLKWDNSGTVLPCGKPVTAEDLPTGLLPGLSDLPNTGAGLPTSILTNEAVLGLALGVVPAPCDVSDPLADPVVNPAVEPGEYDGPPTLDLTQGSFDTENGLDILRVYEIGLGDGAGTTEGISLLKLQQDEQRILQELEIYDSEYDYLLVSTDGKQSNRTVTGGLESSIRDGYVGLDSDVENELGTGNVTAGLTASVVGNEATVSITCTPSGCQPDYEGLPKLGDFPPELPNPLAGDTGLPA